MEGAVRRIAARDVVKRSSAQDRQDPLDFQQVLEAVHIDMDVQSAIEIEADDRALGAGTGQHVQDLVQLVGDDG